VNTPDQAGLFSKSLLLTHKLCFACFRNVNLTKAQAEADAARVVAQQVEKERSIAASNLAAQRARLDALSAKERLAEHDREAKIDALLGMLEAQDTKMTALRARFSNFTSAFDTKVGKLSTLIDIEDLRVVFRAKKERLGMMAEEVYAFTTYVPVTCRTRLCACAAFVSSWSDLHLTKSVLCVGTGHPCMCACTMN